MTGDDGNRVQSDRYGDVLSAENRLPALDLVNYGRINSASDLRHLGITESFFRRAEQLADAP